MLHGLGNKARPQSWVFSTSGAVCLASDPIVAASYCEAAEETPDTVYESGIVVLEVDGSGLHLEPDTNIQEPDGEATCFICRQVIPAKIKIMKEEVT